MSGKIKTSIVIDRELWYKFRARLLEEGIEEVSGVLEELVREELLEDYVSQSLEEMLDGELPEEVRPVRSLVETRAESIVRALRVEGLEDSVPRYKRDYKALYSRSRQQCRSVSPL